MYNLGDLLDLIVEKLPQTSDEEDDDTTKIAVIGWQTSENPHLSMRCWERNVVSVIAGTTRDSIDTPFTNGEDKYILIDTAGIRRKSKVTGNIEKYSVIRAITAIERDVCLLMLDATEGLPSRIKDSGDSP